MIFPPLLLVFSTANAVLIPWESFPRPTIEKRQERLHLVNMIFMFDYIAHVHGTLALALLPSIPRHDVGSYCSTAANRGAMIICHTHQYIISLISRLYRQRRYDSIT